MDHMHSLEKMGPLHMDYMRKYFIPREKFCFNHLYLGPIEDDTWQIYILSQKSLYENIVTELIILEFSLVFAYTFQKCILMIVAYHSDVINVCICLAKLILMIAMYQLLVFSCIPCNADK